MARAICGVTTSKGYPCPWPPGECPVPWHADERRARGEWGPGPRAPFDAAPAQRRVAAPAARPATPADDFLAPVVADAGTLGWYADRSLYGLGWWLVGAAIEGRVGGRQATILTGVARLLAGLGAPEINDEDALAEVELRGRLMYGQPPRTAAEWERAATIFDDDAMEEFRRWERLRVERDRVDRAQPFDLRERAADQVDVPGVVDREDGI